MKQLLATGREPKAILRNVRVFVTTLVLLLMFAAGDTAQASTFSGSSYLTTGSFWIGGGGTYLTIVPSSAGGSGGNINISGPIQIGGAGILVPEDNFWIEGWTTEIRLYTANTHIYLGSLPVYNGTVSGTITCGKDGWGLQGSGSSMVLFSAPSCSGSLSFTDTMYTLTVGKAGGGSGTVTGSGINCGADCSEAYTAGTVVSLSATPAGGSSFLGWSGGGCSGTGACNVTMNSAQSVTATFGTSNPTVSISGYSPAIVPYGDYLQSLFYSSTNASYCNIARSGFSTLTSQPTSGSPLSMVTGPLYSNMPVTVTCYNGVGASASANTTVLVASPPTPPSASVSWSPNPVGNWGAGSTVTWSSSNANYCRFYLDGANVGNTDIGWPFNNPGWTYGITVPKTYRIECSNSIGQWATAQATANGIALGVVDSVTSGAACGLVNGWSFDPATPSASNEVHFYRDGIGYNPFNVSPPPPNGTPDYRGDVNAAYGISGNHGFVNYQLPGPLTVGSHTLQVYSIGAYGNRLIHNSSFSCSAPATPTITSATCVDTGVKARATITWSSSAGATYYGLRVDAAPDSWSGTCSGGGDFCADVTGTSYSWDASYGATYDTWVHAVNDAGWSGNNPDTRFSCPQSPAPTVSISPTNTAGVRGQTTTFTVTSSDPTQPDMTIDTVNWIAPGQSQWNWENGSYGRAETPGSEYTYFAAAGNKTTIYPFTPTVAGTYTIIGGVYDNGVNGGRWTATPQYTFTVTEPNQTLTVTKPGTGGGTVTSNPAGINCGATCNASYAYNTPVSLTATPDSNSYFAGWSGGCSGTGACNVTMNSAVNVTATFAPNVPAVTLTPQTTLGGSTGSAFYGEYNAAWGGVVTNVSWSATNNPTSCVVYRNGVAVSSSSYPGTAQYNIPAGEAITGSTNYRVDCVNGGVTGQSNTVTFTVPPPATNPTVTCGPAGVGASLGWTPPGGSAGNYIRGHKNPPAWTGTCTGGELCVTDGTNPYGWYPIASNTPHAWWVHSRTADGNWSAPIGSTFSCTPVTYTLTTSATNGTITSNPAGITCGSGGSDCSEAYSYGTAVVLTPTPAGGYAFSSWGGDCSGSGACVVTMTQARNVTATFAASSHTLTVSKAGPGAGTVTATGISCGTDCSESYSSGTNVTLSAVADGGSVFAGWSGNVDCADGAVTMSADKTCTATFETTTGGGSQVTELLCQGTNDTSLGGGPCQVAYNTTATTSWQIRGSTNPAQCTILGDPPPTGGIVDTWTGNESRPKVTSPLGGDTTYFLSCYGQPIDTVDMDVDTNPELWIDDGGEKKNSVVVSQGQSVMLRWDTKSQNCTGSWDNAIRNNAGFILIPIGAQTDYRLYECDSGATDSVRIEIISELRES